MAIREKEEKKKNGMKVTDNMDGEKKADEKSEVGLMVQVIDAVRLAGVEQYSIAASEK